MKKSQMLTLVMALAAVCAVSTVCTANAAADKTQNPQSVNQSEKEYVEDQHKNADIGNYETGDDDSFTSEGLGLFLHWSICSVKEMNISWPMIPGRVLATSETKDPAELDRIIKERDFNLNGTRWAITPNEYWAMAKDFNPSTEYFDRWCAAAKKAGFTYAVLTARHHDGFALWPSEYGDFNTKNYMGGKDLIDAYVKACRKNGLKIGIYFSPGDWYHFRETNNFIHRSAKRRYKPLDLDADLQQRTVKPDKENIDRLGREHAEDVRGQITELLTNYGDIDVWWFDGRLPRGSITLAEIRELQPQMAINNRGAKGGDFMTYERHFPTKRPNINRAAEFCDTWNGNWPHTPLPYRAPSWATGQLAKCRAWDMNFLLGIGPMANGNLSEQAYRNIETLGTWIAKHKESVLNGAGSLPENETANVTATANGNARYLFAIYDYEAPSEGIDGQGAANSNYGRLPGNQRPPTDLQMQLSGVDKPASVVLMRTGKPVEYRYDASSRTVSLTLPAALRSSNTDVIKINLPDNNSKMNAR